MEEKRELMFAVYRSETTDKYYVKYRDAEEKEISKSEYFNLLDEKQRILELKLKS